MLHNERSYLILEVILKSKKQRFRESRTAIVIDVLLLPFGILRSLFLAGVPETCHQLRKFPGNIAGAWKSNTHWF